MFIKWLFSCFIDNDNRINIIIGPSAEPRHVYLSPTCLIYTEVYTDRDLIFLIYIRRLVFITMHIYINYMYSKTGDVTSYILTMCNGIQLFFVYRKSALTYFKTWVYGVTFTCFCLDVLLSYKPTHQYQCYYPYMCNVTRRFYCTHFL